VLGLRVTSMHSYDLILTLAGALTAALIFGFITQRLGVSPILGYLLAGIAVGPRTPGFVANGEIATQLAELGIILLMFGVGLHFQLKELLKVRHIAIPGAIAQSLVSAALGTLIAEAFGWSLASGLVLGISMAVASTVVLIRMLTDHETLDTPQGHVAVGWLIVEDIFTVIILLMVPVLASLRGAETSVVGMVQVVGLGLAKLGLLIALVLVLGPRVVPWFLTKVARSRSRELFTLAVLAIAIAIAAGASHFFGASMALGAFLAGTVVGQSRVSHQAAADALPMRDAFAVLFFVSVGMLFDFGPILAQPGLLLAALAVILIGKPLAALGVVVLLGYSVRTALTVAIGLAQIGEFSFILADVAGGLDLFPPAGRSVLVASAIISIGLNPLLFRLIDPIERWIRVRPRLYGWLQRKSEKKSRETASTAIENGARDPRPRAIVVGFGPVGQTVARILERSGVRPTVVDLNIDTVKGLSRAGQPAVYGDAQRAEILSSAGVKDARYLLVTTPDPAMREAVIESAKDLNPSIRVFVRARYIAERSALEAHHATTVCYEEIEVAVALADALLREVGAEDPEVAEESHRIRMELIERTEG
jgi:monovalent cation:H+ antiporter-2, CPA2 family